MSESKYTNRLIKEKSPYLLQHAHNPVDWYPWCNEAFEKAKAEDKPVFLSCGYSSCHWCHVMERESFEDDEVASILNQHFISIKVDREERPDIDHIYMTVCQTLTGHGGWPLTVFLTPDRKPFHAGTYYPKNDRMGMPGLMAILEKINQVWECSRETLLRSGDEITDKLNHPTEPRDIARNIDISWEIIHEAYSEFKYDFDRMYGGFGNAPKFPTPHNLNFLLRCWYITGEEYALEMVEKTLDAMRRGGIYDHLGFGFCRYSTDRKWLVPHFEKMLYDNALLAIAYLEAYQATGKQDYAAVAEQIFTYVLRDMTGQDGGFFSAEDADSEGEEGKFHVWSVEETYSVLGDTDGAEFCKYFNITQKGNFEGKNIPNLIGSTIPEEEKELIEECRQKLFGHREKRAHPYKDDKKLTSWNGLMIAAMAVGARVLGNEKYTRAAEKAVEFIYSRLVRKDGRLMARYRDGQSAHLGYVDDYAFLIWGLIELYETTYKPEYLEKALRLNDDLIKLFWDEENGGLFIYGNDSEQLIARPKEIYDGATPSGNSVATLNYLKLARLTGRHELEEKAQQQFKAFSHNLQQMPRGHSFILAALLFAKSTVKEVVVVEGTDSHDNDEIIHSTYEMIQMIRKGFNPFTLSMIYNEKCKNLDAIAPFLTDYKAVNDKTTVYICENFACQAPMTDIGQVREALSR